MRTAATVSAVIATRDRRDHLRQALTGLANQRRPPDEVLVIDDCSGDGTNRMVRAEFPAVRLIRLPHPAGLVWARNFGLANTGGDYVLSVDDDSWFTAEDGLARAVAFLEANAGVGAVGCNVTLPSGAVYFPVDAGPFEIPWYIGCGHLLRRRAVEEVGFYLPEFFRQGEEKERCLRLIGAGWRVVALPDVIVHHQRAELNRDPRQVRLHDHRNDLIRELARCPTRLLPLRLPRVWAGNTWRNLRQGPRTTDLAILWRLPEILRIALRHRAPVPLAAYRRWLHLAATAAPRPRT